MSDEFSKVVPLSHYGHDCNERKCARELTYEIDVATGKAKLVRVIPLDDPKDVGR
jgi:hypothetical protein